MGKKYDEVIARLDPMTLCDYSFLDMKDCKESYDPSSVCTAFYAGFLAACEIARGANPEETVLHYRKTFNSVVQKTDAVEELIGVLEKLSKELPDVDR